MSIVQSDYLYLQLCVPSAAGNRVLENEPGIHCFGFRGQGGAPPLIVVWDDVAHNKGASATNSIEAVLRHLASCWEHRMEVTVALVVERDSVGDFDHAYPDWLSDTGMLLQRQPRINWKPLRWPGAKPRSEAAFLGMFGDRARQVLDHLKS